MTALGKHINGEGLIRLTCAFKHSGAPRVVAKLCPRLNKPTLRARQIACDEFDRIEAEHTNVPLVIRMNVRRMVDGASFDEHANDDAEDAILPTT